MPRPTTGHLTSRAMILPVLCTAFVVGACGVHNDSGLSSAATSDVSAARPVSRQSAPPSPSDGCRDRYPAQIPAGVFLAEVNPENRICYTAPDPASGDPKPQPVLPAICAEASHASDALISDRRGYRMMYAHKGTTTPRVYAHTVTKYHDSGAQDYLTELRQEAGRCGGYVDGVAGVRGAKYEYAVVAGPRLGDDALRLTLRKTLQEPAVDIVPRRATFHVSVIRKGDYVSVVFDLGWEGKPSSPTAIGDITQRAANHLPAT